MSELPLTASDTKRFRRARDDVNRSFYALYGDDVNRSFYALYGYATKDHTVTLANALRRLSEISTEIADKLEKDDDDE